MSRDKTYLYGDGEQFIIFLKDMTWGPENKKGYEFAYSFKNPIVNEVTVSIDNDYAGSGESIPSFGGKMWLPKGKPEVKFKIDGVCKAEDFRVDQSDVGGLVPQIDMFKNVKVSDLFLAINKKLQKREKGEK